MESVGVLFRDSPTEPRERTSRGLPVGCIGRRPRRHRLETLRRLFNIQCQLLSGPFLAAFDALCDPECP